MPRTSCMTAMCCQNQHSCHCPDRLASHVQVADLERQTCWLALTPAPSMIQVMFSQIVIPDVLEFVLGCPFLEDLAGPGGTASHGLMYVGLEQHDLFAAQGPQLSWSASTTGRTRQGSSFAG